MEALFEVIGMVLIVHFIDTDALAAYRVFEILLCTIGDFIDGIIDGQTTVATHAVGAENNYIAGLNTQIAAVLYVIAAAYPEMIWLDFLWRLMCFR